MKLEPLNLARLLNLEFGQHTKSICTDITASGVPITDIILTQYLADLNLKSTAYDRAMLQVAKSDETARITEADDRRDKDFTCVQRQLSVFEFSSDADELSSYASLNNLFNNYIGMHNWNYERETNGIDNLVDDLQSDKYSNSVDILGMDRFVIRLKASNNDFKTLFSGRTLEESDKEVFNVKELKNDLKTSYEKLINYVVTMATAVNTEEFNKILSIINTIRKYYSDMIARRTPEKKIPKTPTPSEN